MVACNLYLYELLGGALCNPTLPNSNERSWHDAVDVEGEGRRAFPYRFHGMIIRYRGTYRMRDSLTSPSFETSSRPETSQNKLHYELYRLVSKE